MPWLPVMILVVFGIVSIGLMIYMPEKKAMHNIKRAIRGVEPASVKIGEVTHNKF